MEIALLITYFIAIFLLSFIEFKKYNSILTPFTVLVLPYTGVVAYVHILGWHRNYFPVTMDSIWLVLMNVFVFWLAGHAIWLLYRGNTDVFDHQILDEFVMTNRLGLRIILVLGILAGFASFLQTVAEIGFNAMGTELFQLKYRTGIFGHIVLFAYPSFILVGALWFQNKNKFELLLLVLMLSIVLAAQVKYRIILLLLPTFYLAIFCKTIKKLTIKNVVAFIAVIFFIFMSAYFIGFSVTLGFDRAVKLMQYTFFAFEDYVVAGPIALGGFLEMPENSLSSDIIYTVPINIYRFIQGGGNYVNPIIRYFQPIASDFAIPNNTGTMFTPLYLCLGRWGSIIFMTFLGIFVYLLYNYALRYSRIILIFLSSHFLALLTVSFFGYHLHLLPLWEVAAAMIVTTMIFSIPKLLPQIPASDKL